MPSFNTTGEKTTVMQLNEDKAMILLDKENNIITSLARGVNAGTVFFSYYKIRRGGPALVSQEELQHSV